jgi:hypothetical protein
MIDTYEEIQKLLEGSPEPFKNIVTKYIQNVMEGKHLQNESILEMVKSL